MRNPLDAWKATEGAWEVCGKVHRRCTEGVKSNFDCIDLI